MFIRKTIRETEIHLAASDQRNGIANAGAAFDVARRDRLAARNARSNLPNAFSRLPANAYTSPRFRWNWISLGFSCTAVSQRSEAWAHFLCARASGRSRTCKTASRSWSRAISDGRQIARAEPLGPVHDLSPRTPLPPPSRLGVVVQPITCAEC